MHELHFGRSGARACIERIRVERVGEKDQIGRKVLDLSSSVKAHDFEVVSAIIGRPLVRGTSSGR